MRQIFEDSSASAHRILHDLKYSCGRGALVPASVPPAIKVNARMSIGDIVFGWKNNPWRMCVPAR